MNWIKDIDLDDLPATRRLQGFRDHTLKKNQYKIAMNDHILSGNAIFKAKIKISAHIDS